tara:strand:+ start:14168 stop:16207 length:2040 start_codon:yes stop_codon:yes gene_type:complete
MKLLNFTIIKLTICLIIGVLIGCFYPVSIKINYYILGILLSILTASYFISKKQFHKTIWFGIIAFFTMISIGVLTVNIHNQKLISNHYSHFIPSEKGSTKTITLRIREVLKPGNFYDKYIVDVLKIDDTPVSGKTLINILKDSTDNNLKVDSVLITKTEFKDVFEPLNPGQFNYKSYLKKQYIYHQLFLTNQDLFKVKSSKKTLFGIANQIREFVNLKLSSHSFKPDELAIINAMLLGQRQNISEDVYTSYRNAGAIHILAISGLHIGIILIILSYIFKPFERFKHGYLIKTILLVTILWSFAIIAGLSASVTRAVTMFSIIAVGLNLKRPTNIYNTLAISIFVLLLFKPLFLFDVGFQLSYFAVFGIVAIDPYLYKLWKPKYWATDKLWHTLTVTISAQLGIIPISLYYFHQFPALFFLSNLIIIPFLGFILGFGILIILLAVLNILPTFLANIYGSIIDLMNSLVGWVAQQQDFLIRDIPFSLLYVLVSYIFIISFVRFLIKRNYKRLVLFFVAIIFVQCAIIYTIKTTPKNQFIVFHKSRYSLLGNANKNKMMVTHNFDSITKTNDKIIQDFSVKNHIKSTLFDSLQSVYILGNKKLLIIDSLGIYDVKSFSPEYVLLRNSPKINLNRLIDSIHPVLIIADGSNYKSYVERWKTTSNKSKIPFHQTSEKGAFIIEY